MRPWLTQPDGDRRYAAIKKPYELLLTRLDELASELDSRQAGRGQAEKQTFIAFLSTAFSMLRAPCLPIVVADGLDDTVDFVLRGVLADEQQTAWLATRQDPGDLMWNGQFAGKSYRRCLHLARTVGPLYARGYHADRAFVGHGRLPRGAPAVGDKLHLSVDPWSFVRVRDTVLPRLAAKGYTHKIVADVSDLTNGQEGKIVTIYPKFRQTDRGLAVDQDALHELADDLVVFVAERGIRPGPPVAGDKPWAGSGIVYLSEMARLR